MAAEYAYITDTAQLEKLVADIAKSPYLAIDTEFHRERTYYPTLCLIQVSTDDTLAAIDPLADGMDLTPLLEQLQDTTQLKVFHAGKQDLEIFYHLTGKVLTPVFDTQIAAMALGLGDQLSYGHLVQKTLGVRLEKGHQMADWTRRPLGEGALKYAMDDVIYLRRVYHDIEKKLRDKGRLAWIEDEHQRLLGPDSLMPRPDDLWRSIRVRDKTARTLTILRDLAIWRDTLARKANVPRSYIIKDDAMAAIAQRRPRSPQDLQELRVVPKDVTKNHGETLVKIVQEALATPKDKQVTPPPSPRPGQLDSVATNFASLLLRYRASEADVAPRLIASSDDLDKFLQGDRKVGLAKGWRYDLVGQELELMLEGKVALRLKGGSIEVMPVS